MNKYDELVKLLKKLPNIAILQDYSEESSISNYPLTQSERIIDIVFLCIFIFTILFLLLATYRSFKPKEHRDLYNILTVSFILLTSISKYLSFTHINLSNLVRVACLVTILSQDS